MVSIITKFKSTPAERKDTENAIAMTEKHNAVIEYIAICDHPEILEDEQEVTNE